MEESIKAKIQIPKPPDFILDESGTHKYPISAFSNEALRRIGECWVEDLITRAKELRKEKDA